MREIMVNVTCIIRFGLALCRRSKILWRRQDQVRKSAKRSITSISTQDIFSTNSCTWRPTLGAIVEATISASRLFSGVAIVEAPRLCTVVVCVDNENDNWLIVKLVIKTLL